MVLRIAITLFAAATIGCDDSTTTHSKQNGTQNEQGSPPQYRMGAEVYSAQCSLCHDHGEAGAPRVGNAKQWSKRVAKGIDVLTNNAFDGFEGQWGEMPAQNESLSRDQVNAAVGYMIYRYEADN